MTFSNRLLELGLEGRAYAINGGLHGGVGRQQLRKDRQQMVSIVGLR